MASGELWGCHSHQAVCEQVEQPEHVPFPKQPLCRQGTQCMWEGQVSSSPSPQ